MKEEKIIIKEVTLAKPTGNSDNGASSESGIHIESKSIEFETVRIADCVIDIASNTAIEIETNEVFPIVKRDRNNRIDKSEAELIAKGDTVALHLLEKDWKKISMLYQINLKARAKKVYMDYLKNKQKDEAQKIKTIGKKKS